MMRDTVVDRREAGYAGFGIATEDDFRAALWRVRAGRIGAVPKAPPVASAALAAGAAPIVALSAKARRRKARKVKRPKMRAAAALAATAPRAALAEPTMGAIMQPTKGPPTRTSRPAGWDAVIDEPAFETRWRSDPAFRAVYNDNKAVALAGERAIANGQARIHAPGLASATAAAKRAHARGSRPSPAGITPMAAEAVAGNDAQRIIARWKADAAVRAEFGDNLAAFAAYAEAELGGRAKVVGGRGRLFPETA